MLECWALALLGLQHLVCVCLSGGTLCGKWVLVAVCAPGLWEDGGRWELKGRA